MNMLSVFIVKHQIYWSSSFLLEFTLKDYNHQPCRNNSNISATHLTHVVLGRLLLKWKKK